MLITANGRYPLNYTTAYTGRDARRLVLASGNRGEATITIGYSDHQGKFIPFKNRTFVTDTRMEIFHGVDIVPELEVLGGNPNLNLRIWVTGVNPEGLTGQLNTNPGTSGGGDAAFTFVQATTSAVWVVNHGLGKFPSTTVVDNSGAVVQAQVVHTDVNHTTITFTLPFAGKAHFN